MLTLGAYVDYVGRRFSLLRYVGVLLLFTCGLMAKPVLVTMPFLLLLLDYWPLGRMGTAAGEEPTAKGGFSIPALVVEKIPFLLPAAVFCVLTPFAEGVALTGLDVVPMSWRIANIPVAYVAYLAKLFYPVGLAVPYLHLGSVPVWKVVSSLLLCWSSRRQRWLVGEDFPFSWWAGCGIWECSCRCSDWCRWDSTPWPTATAT